MAKHFFFILSKPRCRTAWFSALLTEGDTYCFHEGMNGCATFEDYVAKLKARPETHVGDASPSLVLYYDQLKEAFPEADMVIIDRRDAMEAFCRAAPRGYDTSGFLAGWNAYQKAFDYAHSEISKAGLTHFWKIPGISHDAWWLLIVKGLGLAANPERFERFKSLHIVSNWPVVEKFPKPIPPKKQTLMEAAGLSSEGLTVRAVTKGDFALLNWCAQSHNGVLPESSLPPLGVLVSDSDGPACALWCFETYGSGVAWLEYPVTRPGLSVAEAQQVLAFAIQTLMESAGSGYDPPATFTRFRVNAPPAMGRFLRKLGFVGPDEPRECLVYHKT
jgi:hypothetical protein